MLSPRRDSNGITFYMTMMSNTAFVMCTNIYYKINFSLYPYPTNKLYNMFSSCCYKDSEIIFTTACLTSTLLETRMLGTANAAGANSLTCFPKHGGARDNKFWSPILES
jgi:hypothetical protein